MSEPDLAIATVGLCKSYGARAAVRDLSINVPRGSIAGFVGPNGSGKTTTLRMLLGLVRPTAGTANVLDSSITHPRSYMHRVGALIESPAFYPTLSGMANLKVLARLGGYSSARISVVLEQVGLIGRERDKVAGYSLGMKQRLGVAAALLPDPELLILDEPANGLDPPGIIEMRDLMRTLRDSGKTIFVSSHLLGELEQVADWLVVLKDGQAVYTGRTADIRAAHEEALIMAPERADQLEALTQLAIAHGYAATVTDARVVVGAAPAAAAQLNRDAMNAGIVLVEIRVSHATLEESFLALIGGTS